MGRRLRYPREALYPSVHTSTRPIAIRPMPADFRERYIEAGWDAQIDYRCGWPVFCRWIDEAGGNELRDARAAYVREHGRSIRGAVGTEDSSDSRWYDKRSQRIPARGAR